MITTHRIRLLALTLSIASLATPAAARTTDTPTFGVWMAQWAQYGRQSAAERLPCLRADKTSCKGAFSSSLAARASGPSSHAAKSAKPKRYDPQSQRRTTRQGHELHDIDRGQRPLPVQLGEWRPRAVLRR
jgi:hypothetical protein